MGEDPAAVSHQRDSHVNEVRVGDVVDEGDVVEAVGGEGGRVLGQAHPIQPLADLRAPHARDPQRQGRARGSAWGGGLRAGGGVARGEGAAARRAQIPSRPRRGAHSTSPRPVGAENLGSVLTT